MFKIGEQIVHVNNGVCEICDICKSPFNKNDEKLYYVLKPIFGPSGSTVYTPVENKAVIMRRLLSADELISLIESIPKIPEIKVELEKQRKDIYKNAMSSANPVEYIKIIKTVKLRRLAFDKAKKHLPNTDTDYEALAKRRIFEEIASVLSMPLEEVDDFIHTRLELINEV